MTCRATLLRSKLQSGLLSAAFCNCSVQQTNKSKWQTSLVIIHCLHTSLSRRPAQEAVIVHFNHPLDTPLKTNNQQQSRGTVPWKYSAATRASAIS